MWRIGRTDCAGVAVRLQRITRSALLRAVWKLYFPGTARRAGDDDTGVVWDEETSRITKCADASTLAVHATRYCQHTGTAKSTWRIEVKTWKTLCATVCSRAGRASPREELARQALGASRIVVLQRRTLGAGIGVCRLI